MQNSKAQTSLTSVIQDFVHLSPCVFVSDIIHFMFEQGVDSVVTTLGSPCLQYEELESQTSFESLMLLV